MCHLSRESGCDPATLAMGLLSKGNSTGEVMPAWRFGRFTASGLSVASLTRSADGAIRIHSLSPTSVAAVTLMICRANSRAARTGESMSVLRGVSFQLAIFGLGKLEA